MKKIKSEAELNAALEKNDCTVLKLGAPWCGPCRVLESTIGEIENTNADAAEFLEVDVDEADEEFVDSLKVRNIPILIYYKGTDQIERTVGLVSATEILDKISKIKG